MYISGSRCICRVAPLLSLLDSLTEIATDLNFPGWIEGSLVAELNTALWALDDVNEKNDVAGINALVSFINAVATQRGKQISKVLADALIKETEQIIALLNET